MPSFDVVSRVNEPEVRNAVDQASREIANRFDFKGTDARVESGEGALTIHAPDEFRADQVRDILRNKLAKRGVDLGCLEEGAVERAAGDTVRQVLRVRQGIDMELARSLVGLIKRAKFKVQAAIQGDQVRVTGKKRDDLQKVMALLREADTGLPLQFVNFRD